MTVSKILARKGRRVFTIKSSATLAAAASLLAKRRVGALVVIGARGSVAGIISERDIVRALAHRGAAALSLPIAKAMTSTVATCAESNTVVQIMNKMTRGRFRHMPVVQRGSLAGLVSMGDAVKFRLGDLEDTLTNAQNIIASIAHEVRQPLTAIATRGGAALRFLQRAPVDIDEIRAGLNAMIEDSHRTSAVFDSIRSLFGSPDRRRQLVNLNEVILEALESLRGELEDREIIARSDLTVELPLVYGHRTQLQEVVTNLIRNAVEAMDATKDRARVLKVVTDRRNSNAIRVAVEDSGPGIPPKQLRRVFDVFVTTKATGMGLGLAICKMIIERHGGNISALSDGRSGTTMQVILPILGRK
jgi:signal transduction histidine kinase